MKNNSSTTNLPALRKFLVIQALDGSYHSSDRTDRGFEQQVNYAAFGVRQGQWRQAWVLEAPNRYQALKTVLDWLNNSPAALESAKINASMIGV